MEEDKQTTSLGVGFLLTGNIFKSSSVKESDKLHVTSSVVKAVSSSRCNMGQPFSVCDSEDVDDEEERLAAMQRSRSLRRRSLSRTHRLSKKFLR